MRKGTRLPPRSLEHRRKLSAAGVGNQRAAQVLRDWAERRRVVFDTEMTSELLRLRARGCNVEAIAAWIGVGRDAVMRELRARGLPTGRWRSA